MILIFSYNKDSEKYHKNAYGFSIIQCIGSDKDTLMYNIRIASQQEKIGLAFHVKRQALHVMIFSPTFLRSPAAFFICFP